jgi:hypothetical protein
MARTTETSVVYAAGVVQGIALVTFPAASTILTDPAEYDPAGVELSTVYACAAVVAAAMGLWSLVVVGRRSSPASLRPQVGGSR